MKKFLLLVSASAVSIFLSVNTIYAQTESEKYMLGIIDYIAENSKYEYHGEPLPFIEFVTADEACRKVFTPEGYEKIIAEEGTCTRIAALYDNTMNVIYMNEDRLELEDGYESTLAHELVHYLQYINGEDKKVQCFRAMERDAYKLQDKYIVDHELNPETRPNLLFAHLISMCDDGMGPYGAD